MGLKPHTGGDDFEPVSGINSEPECAVFIAGHTIRRWPVAPITEATQADHFGIHVGADLLLIEFESCWP